MEDNAGSPGAIYESPRRITDVSECAFYHTMEVPGHGVVEGQWDLRAGVDEYLGHVEVRGKRVLELGTADGYLSFHMERQGAEVVSFDLSDEDQWDIVPFARRRRTPAHSDDSLGAAPSWVTPDTGVPTTTMAKLNNAYWLCHGAFGSEARLVTGTVYAIPDIGPVEISVFGSLLLHTRDPFGALTSALGRTRETVVVTDALGLVHLPGFLRWARSFLPPPLRRPLMRFMPDWRTGEGPDGWWRLTPEIVVAFLGVLGFERCHVTTHRQPYNGSPKRVFTVVGTRTVRLDGA